MSLEVANTIRQQIGNRAFFMMGAKDLAGDENSLRWRVGRNAKGVNLVQVQLDPDDTYTVRSYRVRKVNHVPEAKVVSEDSGVYADNLHQIIESQTGLYLSL